MTLTRRELLAAGAASGAIALAGCTEGCGQGLPFFGTEMPHDGVVATEPASSVPEDATVVAVAELPDQERSVLRTAIQEGVVRVCMDEDGKRAQAIRSFADRVTVESSYVSLDGDRYALYVRVEDVIATDTASPPENGEDPCC